MLDKNFLTHGKTFVRYIDLCVRPSKAIEHALARISDQHRGLNMVYVYEDERKWDSWEKLVAFIPGLEAMVAEAGVARLKIIKASLDRGATQGRSDNITALKESVYDWIEQEGCVPDRTTRPMRSEKSKLGFTNETTARLLCPCTLNLDAPGVRIGLEQNTTGKTPLPLLFFHGYKFDPTDVDGLFGMLRSNLGLFAYQLFFTGPSSVGTPVDGSRSTRKTNSELAGYDFVTYESVAYALTLLRFVLSAKSKFRLKDKEFNYGACYTQIITTLKFECSNVDEDSQEPNAGQRLMIWWNEKVFGKSADDGSNVDNPEHMVAILARKRAEVEAARLAAQTAA